MVQGHVRVVQPVTPLTTSRRSRKARERLTAAPSWLRSASEEKACVRRAGVDTRPTATSRVSQTAGRPFQPRRAKAWFILDEKTKAADATNVHNLPARHDFQALPKSTGAPYSRAELVNVRVRLDENQNTPGVRCSSAHHKKLLDFAKQAEECRKNVLWFADKGRWRMACPPQKASTDRPAITKG